MRSNGKIFVLQVKALTSLEVARQRQANRAQLHLDPSAQPQGPFPFPAQTSGQLQGGSRLPQAPYPGQWAAGQVQQGGLSNSKLSGSALGKRLGSISEKAPALVRPGRAQQARAKLEAIRNELGEAQT